MSWISKAENLLNKIDKSAAEVLQASEVPVPAPVIVQIQSSPQIPKVPSSKNVLILSKSTPKKPAKNELDDRWETMSEKTASRRSSISSRHDTVIDKNEDQKSEHMKESASSASLNSFSVEKELAATKILVSELRSENNELKSELESLMEQTKANGDPEKVLELESICVALTEEKRELTVM